MSLKKIAASMHVEAKEKRRAFRRLSGGLRLTLYYRPSPKDDIVLKLSRQRVGPSDTEIEVCKMNFFGILIDFDGLRLLFTRIPKLPKRAKKYPPQSIFFLA